MFTNVLAYNQAIKFTNNIVGMCVFTLDRKTIEINAGV